MSDYNLVEANIWFISAAAFLARDMGLDVQRKPLGIKAQRALKRRIDNWRESTMKMIQQHQRAHKRIKELEEKAEFNELWISQTCETGQIKAERNQNIASGATWILTVAPPPEAT
ncbi:MAG: hypothetical protein GY922_03085 [Proteobacteria bacterium]|nr:hypothetical protein [Pseudomonadota bacterium]